MIVFQKLENVIKGDVSKIAVGNVIYTFVKPTEGIVIYDKQYDKTARMEAIFYKSQFDSKVFLEAITKGEYHSESALGVVEKLPKNSRNFILEYFGFPSEVETLQIDQYLYVKSGPRGIIIF